MLSRDNKRKGVFNFTTQQTYSRANEAVVSLNKMLNRTQSGYKRFGKD